MIVVTVARKPLSESSVASNVLEHGTGVLNINASRISTSENLNGGAYSAEAEARHDGAENWRYKRGEQGGLAGVGFKQPTGRWPANLILGHLEGCRSLGVVKAPGTSIHGESTAVRRSGVHAEAGGHQTVRGYSDADGMESILAYACEPGCPVADLDAQGAARGAHFAGSATQTTPGAADPGSANGVTYHFGGSSGRIGDAGGVSRFFKQVGGKR